MNNSDAYPNHRVPNTPAYQFNGQQLVSDQVSKEDVGVVWRELARILRHNVPGDVVEFGCYVGTTSLFIRRLLGSQKVLHVYDSFAGLPPKSSQDASAAGADFTAGKLSVNKKELLQQFRAANLAPPVIHKGWFEDLTPADVPDRIAFAFLDGDFYHSILTSLKLVWPRLQPGGAVLIDDYKRPELPGVERAVADFFRSQPMPRLRVEHNIAIIEV
ncbi:MAG TPA: TylF/MycF/NovP-related O-methyltransferase [Candidatus Saccharimonadales bacterium]|nr:TylF/MycF/NovP-related O-methyltransferase [Candidatus Saccharimonadales bacterium]